MQMTQIGNNWGLSVMMNGSALYLSTIQKVPLSLVRGIWSKFLPYVHIR